MPMFKVCKSCKETFIADSPLFKLCPVCNAKSQTPPAERAKKNYHMKPDKLMLDVRMADAAGLSYGVWRQREDEKKRKAKEAIHSKIEEKKRRRAAESENQDGKSKT